MRSRMYEEYSEARLESDPLLEALRLHHPEVHQSLVPETPQPQVVRPLDPILTQAALTPDPVKMPVEPSDRDTPHSSTNPVLTAPDDKAHVPALPLVGKRILQFVSEEFNISVGNIMGTRRLTEVVDARCAAYYLLKKYRPQLSRARIGRFFKKDHTTVLHGLKRLGYMLTASDPRFEPVYAIKIQSLETRIEHWIKERLRERSTTLAEDARSESV